MLEMLMPWMHLTGRILFAMIFIGSGMNHLTKLDDMAGYAASKGVPAPKMGTLVSGLVMLAGGLMIATGWHRFIGAGMIALLMVPTSFMMHAFWKETDPMAKMNEMTHFLKNMAIIGGALMIAYYAGDAWPMSL